MVRWELKNKKTGKLYWVTDKTIERFKKLGFLSRYVITEIKPIGEIKEPFEIKKKITKTKKSD